jgi:Glycosyl hydrolase catalytic core
MVPRIAVAVCLVLAALPAASARAAPVSSHAMLYSCCTPFEMKERIFAESAALGAEYVRVDVQLNDIFEADTGGPAPAPDWRGLDEVTALARKYRVKVLGILLNPPSWLSECPELWPNHVRCATTDPAEFGRLAGAVAAHAGNAIDHWEVINEPDGDWAFEGSAEQYAQMLVASYAAIKARIPQDRIVFGGVMRPHDITWLQRVFAVPRAAQSFDIANVHLRGSVDAVVARFREFRAQLVRMGFKGPVWVTEHGYPADPALQTDPAFTGGDAAQAGYLTQSLVGLGEAGAGQTFVTLRDQGTTGKYATEGVEHLVEAPGYAVQRRLAFTAVRRLANQWQQVMAWRLEQRQHELLERMYEGATTLSRDQARTTRQRLRQARAVAGDARRLVSRAARQSDVAAELTRAERKLARARRSVARFRREYGWHKAVLDDYRLRGALHAAAVADLKTRIAGG